MAFRFVGPTVEKVRISSYSLESRNFCLRKCRIITCGKILNSGNHLMYVMSIKVSYFQKSLKFSGIVISALNHRLLMRWANVLHHREVQELLSMGIKQYLQSSDSHLLNINFNVLISFFL